jgi:hypothetical protein
MKCVCGKEFESRRKTAKYCSVRCKLAYHRGGVSVSGVPLSVSVSVSGDTVKPVSVSKVVSVSDTVKCSECELLRLENKKLVAKVSLLELQIKKGVVSKVEPLRAGDDEESLRKRVLSQKFDRFREIGLNAH